MTEYHDTRTDKSPFYVRVGGHQMLSSDEACTEAMARWESARDQGLAYASIAALNTAVWLCQDVLTNEELNEAVCNAMAATYPRPIFNVEPRVPQWALGLLEHDDRYRQLEPGMVHIPPAAQEELVAHLRQRLVKAAWRLEGDTESLSEDDLTSIAESIEDARDAMKSLTSPTGATVQPATTYLRELVAEAHAASESKATLAEVLGQLIDNVTRSDVELSTLKVTEVAIPDKLVELVREGLLGVMTGAAADLDQCRDWRTGAERVRLSTGLIDRVEAHESGDLALSINQPEAEHLVRAIDYIAAGIEDDARAAKDGAEIVRLARTLEQLRMLREAITDRVPPAGKPDVEAED